LRNSRGARGAGNRADTPTYLIKRSQELGAGKYALFTYSLFVAKKKKLGKLGEKKERKRKEVHDIELLLLLALVKY
jgi:hypothetical protein